MLDLTGAVFNLYGMENVFDAYFVDSDGTCVMTVLDIG